MARVALVHNLITPEMLASGPFDATAELDSEHTIAALADALEAGGHTVIPVDVDDTIIETLKLVDPDIVFNIAEGLRGESREAQVPAICEMLGIPYTGSGVLALALCLDKALTKKVLLFHGIPTAAFQIFESASDPLDGRLHFPLICKLLHEGSSMGLSDKSVVADEAALREQVAYLIRTYHQPALVEEFIDGREFSVPVLGNDELTVLPIVEYHFNKPQGIVLYVPDDTVLPMMLAEHDNVPFAMSRQEFESHLEQANHYSVCPADVTPELKAAIEDQARRVFKTLGLRDWGRMEFRQGQDGRLYVLEVNPIAGIDPSYLFPKSARAAGKDYAWLVNTILQDALRRCGLAEG